MGLKFDLRNEFVEESMADLMRDRKSNANVWLSRIYGHFKAMSEGGTNGLNERVQMGIGVLMDGLDPPMVEQTVEIAGACRPSKAAYMMADRSEWIAVRLGRRLHKTSDQLGNI
jgi:hypothetical protein